MTNKKKPKAEFVTTALYKETKQQVEEFSAHTGLSISEALRRIVPLGIKGYFKELTGVKK